MAERGWQKFQRSNPKWAWRFRVLEAKSVLWRGLYKDVDPLLSSRPGPPDSLGLKASMLTLRAIASARLKDFQVADLLIEQAEQLCSAGNDPSCGEVVQGRGVVLKEKGELEQARSAHETALLFAREHDDHFLEATSLLNLGWVFLDEEHFDEAKDHSEKAYWAASTIGARDVALSAQDNLGWEYYKLGDPERALQIFQTTEKEAEQFGDLYNQENEVTNIGYVQMDFGRFDLAAESFQTARRLAERNKAEQHVYNALRVLALLSVETGQLSEASKYADDALARAHAQQNRQDELYPLIVKGFIAARSNDEAGAERIFREVEQDHHNTPSLKWRSEHALARLYEGQQNIEGADREYRASLATFEVARPTLKRNDTSLSFFANAARIYDDYIHFLYAEGRTNEALRWADYSRARTLSEGLGVLPKARSSGPPPLDAQEIAKRAGGALLFYWLGEKQSYLWVITSQKTSLFALAPATEITAALQRYRRALGGLQDVLDTADDNGQLLYRMLITPAQSLLPKNGRIFILPDGELNNLSFETLLVPSSLVPSSKLHYWIEDVTIANASSLRVLGAGVRPGKTAKRNLLLIGDNLPPNDKYPPLPHAAEQMAEVANHFSQSQRTIFAGAAATAQAYLNSHPETYSHIHFVAHGTASRLSPLDSAIILSRNGTEEDSSKLYAREIVPHPLNAELVVISACNGADGRTYSGEGLVGLSWAFQMAGARKVVAALWEVTDTAAVPLMGKFYDELDRGAAPEQALRAAKLSLLHGKFRNPYYWAPLQLYVGSGAQSKSSQR